MEKIDKQIYANANSRTLSNQILLFQAKHCQVRTPLPVLHLHGPPQTDLRLEGKQVLIRSVYSTFSWLGGEGL